MQKAVRIFNNVRLALFPMAYALSGVLIGSTLNRIMIAELNYSATLVAIFFAIPLMVSPIRIWIGYRSDGYPVLGKRREPYIITGAALIGAGILAITNIITRGDSSALMIGVALAFLLYGLGRNMGHNTFQALVADRYDQSVRSRAATFYEVATMLGMVMGAGLIKKSLAEYDPALLTSVALGVAIAVFVLAFLGAIGQEEKSAVSAASSKARETSFVDSFKQVVMADPQVRLFFFIVILTFVGTLAQDVLLEPYGALVLNMPVGETTGLTQYWGIGVLLAMLASGFFLLKWLGWMKTMRSGMIFSIIAFIGPIIAGMIGNVDLLKVTVFLMGVGTGLAGAGMLSGTLTFTSKLRAGMLLGVWAVANMTGHAFGSITGGVIVDSVRAISGSAFAAYATVFALEAILIALALSLTLRLNLSASRAAMEEKQILSESVSG